jgi:hypothetical protein
MPKKSKLLTTPLPDLPEEYPFFYGRVPTRLIARVEKKRDKEGHTVKAMLETMCELYLKGEAS